ncbi:hypothetical protein Lal_00012939 [Lupinus albus]|nr:hypothetical protein Lal_00012939 [Lupinus albus]
MGEEWLLLKKRAKNEGGEFEGESQKNKIIGKQKRENEKVSSGEERKSESGMKKIEKNVVKAPSFRIFLYPQTPTRKCKERQFPKFIDILKILQINIPFAEAREHMSTNARFMKEMLTKKKNFNEEETIELKASNTAIFQRFMPKNLKIPKVSPSLSQLGACQWRTDLWIPQ